MEYYIGPQGKFSLNLKELWQYRELFWFFTWRDIKVKYKQTLLGFLWAILQPLALMSVFILFFSKGLNISTDDIPAPIFYFSGLLFWNLFSSGLISSADSMVANANIIKKIYFPRLIIPFSGILAALFDFLMAFMIFVVLIFIYYLSVDNFTIHPSIFLYFPMALILALITALGMGCTLAALNVKYRDFRYVIPFAIQFLMFVTPVIYPVTIFDSFPNLKFLLALNPMSGAIILARSPFVGGNVDWTFVGVSIASAGFLLLFGIYVFRKMEAYFADIV
jgi:lipopolysaccharide transport system permease protein